MPDATRRLTEWRAGGPGNGALAEVRSALDEDLDTPAALGAVDAARAAGQGVSEAAALLGVRLDPNDRESGGSGGRYLGAREGREYRSAGPGTLPYCVAAMPDQITVHLPDGSPRHLPAGSTGADLAAIIGRGLAKAAVAVEVDGQPKTCPPPFPTAPTSPSSPPTPTPGATSCATRPPTCWPRP